VQRSVLPISTPHPHKRIEKREKRREERGEEEKRREEISFSSSPSLLLLHRIMITITIKIT
jgi:hypothetical protein